MDVCAGPGGWSEYLFWKYDTQLRKPIRGFGFTLKGEHDFTPDEFYINPRDRFVYVLFWCDLQLFCQLTFGRQELYSDTDPRRLYSQLYGADGTGDVTRSENIRDVAKHVMEATDGFGLSLVMGCAGDTRTATPTA
jgi:cap1 methyltransferase